MTSSHKAARQYSDQYICSHCGKQWDVNDPDPPDCTESDVLPVTQDRVSTQDRVNKMSDIKKPTRADDEFDYINWDVVPELSNVLVECNLGRVYAVQHTNGTCIDGLTGAEIKDYRVLASRPGTQHETPFSVPKEQLARAITDKSGITEPETASIETDCLSVWQSFTDETDLSAITSQRILAEAGEIQVNRGVTYDAPSGERSMGKTVAMFNIYSGLNLTEEQGWHFMEILKMVRSSQGEFKLDNYVDGCSYASLAGEAAARDRGNNS